MKKKILLCLFVIIIILGIALAFAFKSSSQLNNILKEESIIVSINPEVLFNTDNKGKVKEILPINEDAKIYKEEEFLGLEIKEAVNKTVKVAKEHGYVKEDTVVNVSSLNPNSVYLDSIILNLEGNKINVQTKKISKDAIEIIMANIDKTGNVETEITVLDDDYIIIKKHTTIVGPGSNDGELNNQVENNNGISNKQEEEHKKEENKQNITTNNNTTNNNQNNTNNNSNINDNTNTNNDTDTDADNTNNNESVYPEEKNEYLYFGMFYSLEAVNNLENKYGITINLVADAKCGYIEGGEDQLIVKGKTYTVHINSIDPYIEGGCGQ